MLELAVLMQGIGIWILGMLYGHQEYLNGCHIKWDKRNNSLTTAELELDNRLRCVETLILFVPPIFTH